MSTQLGLLQVPIFAEAGDFNVTSPFGYRLHPITNVWSGHSGVDGTLWVNGGSTTATICAYADGTVVDCRNDVPGYSETYPNGNYAAIHHGDRLTTLYLHMAPGSVKVKIGQTVQKGQVLGCMGSTGRSTGAHIHFEVRQNGTPVDPVPYLLSGKEVTDDMIYYFQDITETLRRGAKGDQVKILQAKLAVFGYYEKLLASSDTDVPWDGSFGPATEECVKDYQRKNGLAADGAVGPATRAITNQTAAELLSGKDSRIAALCEEQKKLTARAEAAEAAAAQNSLQLSQIKKILL